MNIKLKEEFDYFLAHHDELVKEHNGKFVVIKGQAVLAFYDDEQVAIQETGKKHKPGTFIVQKVSPGEADYTKTFHSRVAFS